MDGSPGIDSAVAAARGGDRAALEALFSALYPRVLRIAEVRLGARLGKHLDPQDVAQSVFGRALRALPKFEDRGPGSFGAWIEQIVENTISGKDRWAGAQKRVGERAEGSFDDFEPMSSTRSPSARFALQEDAHRLHRAMSSLSERERRVIETRSFLGLKGTDAAEALGMSQEAMRKVHSRALEKLGEHLARQR